jgi:hypothetical protein
VISWLQQSELGDSDILFQIEWAYLPLLDRISGAEPKVLERRLANDPAFFCEAISRVFRSDKEPEPPTEVTEADKNIAENAYRLIHGWRILPGAQPDGTFDGGRFTEWLSEAKRLTEDSGHLRIAMDQLGQALANAPADPDGLWIHQAIAVALDAKDAGVMRDAFTVGLFNKRGVHGFSAGAAERQIAAGYREKANSLADAGFHRLADAVRKLAEDYDADAKRQAEESPFDC